MVLKEFEQKRSFKTRRYKVWSIKKKKNSEWCVAEDKAKNQLNHNYMIDHAYYLNGECNTIKKTKVVSCLKYI